MITGNEKFVNYYYTYAFTKHCSSIAVIARDAAKEELARLEKHLYEERKKREIELQQMKKEAEEKRIQQEKIMTRIVIIHIVIIYVLCYVINSILYY